MVTDENGYKKGGMDESYNWQEKDMRHGMDLTYYVVQNP